MKLIKIIFDGKEEQEVPDDAGFISCVKEGHERYAFFFLLPNEDK